MTEGLTGSEIEAVFVEALFDGFDQGKEPGDLTIASVMTWVYVVVEDHR